MCRPRQTIFVQVGKKNRKPQMYLSQEIQDEGGDEEAEVLRSQWQKEIKISTKDVYLSFYKEVVQCLEEVTSKNRNGNSF